MSNKTVGKMCQKPDNKLYVILVLGIIGIFALIVIAYFSGNVKLSGKIVCDSGNVGVDYKSEFKNQPYTKKMEISETSDTKNISLTKYNTEFFPKELNINGVRDIHCEIEYSIDSPYWFVEKLLQSH